MSLPPYIICCASGQCCQDGSQEQLEALATLIQQESGKQAESHATTAARVVLEHFKLEDRKGRKTREEFGVEA